jgi:hypothetical protein
MAARHKKDDSDKWEKESQGSKKVKPYDAVGSNVEKEVEEKKHGGKVKRRDGGKVEGHAPKMRMDRMMKRASGGRVGADKSPLSSAHGATPPMGHKTDDV